MKKQTGIVSSPQVTTVNVAWNTIFKHLYDLTNACPLHSLTGTQTVQCLPPHPLPSPFPPAFLWQWKPLTSLR